MDSLLSAYVVRLANLMNRRGDRIAVAESCTGGGLAQACTDQAGSSTWFDRGFVTYSNEAKQDMLGVRVETLADHGAVSEAVVREMAQGAIRHSRANVSVAISGIAGPGGGTQEKPVGTVWLAWAGPHGIDAVCEHFAGDRLAVRAASVDRAVAGLLERVR